MADAGGVCIPDFELSKVIPGPGGVKLLVAVRESLPALLNWMRLPVYELRQRDQHHHFQGPGDWVGAHHRNHSRLSRCQNKLLHQN